MPESASAERSVKSKLSASLVVRLHLCIVLPRIAILIPAVQLFLSLWSGGKKVTLNFTNPVSFEVVLEDRT